LLLLVMYILLFGNLMVELNNNHSCKKSLSEMF
jgi:hypothetical protein